MSKQTISLSEAAELLHTTPLNILMHIRRGYLRGDEEDDGWRVDRASLEALREKTGGGKAQDVCASGCAKKHACGGGCS